jgi:putative dimethyl sulfoxide reductase chaperone
MNISWEEVCDVRTQVYGFMGTRLLEPIQIEDVSILQRNFWEMFPLATANAKMKSGLEKLIQCTEQLGKYPVSQALQLTQIEYTHLFHGPGQPKAPPWESVYRTPERLLFGWPALHVREAYLQEGFEITLKNRQPEDHMGLELIFLASVSGVLGKTLNAKNNQAASAIIKRQKEFITSHPLTWISDFSCDAFINESIGFYSALIELIWGVLLWDSELLGDMLNELPMN